MRSSCSGLTVDQIRQTATASARSSCALGDRSRTVCLVERNEHAALRVDPLANLERQVARDIRRRIGNLAERVQLAALTQQEDVGEPFRGEEGRARGAALDDRVRGAGRPVREDVGPPEELRKREAQLGASSASASPMLSNARSRSVGAFARCRATFLVATTTSVNVPPVSTEIR